MILVLIFGKRMCLRRKFIFSQLNQTIELQSLTKDRENLNNLFLNKFIQN